jgi:hypothetical protein
VALFEGGLLLQAVQRLDDDPEYAARHKGLVSRLTSRLQRTGTQALLRKVPARWATPMCFVVRRRGFTPLEVV